jgi:prepilin-type N-terminal cleavage/methylation domain-containing protein
MFTEPNIISLPSCKKAFTLIELLVVIAIIGIITTMTTIALSSMRSRARDSKRVSDLKQIATTLELYYADHNSYPTTLTFGSALVGASNGKTYMAKVPTNPTPRAEGACADLEYQYAGSTSEFSLIGCLAKASGDAPAGARRIERGGNARDLGPIDSIVGWWILDGLNGTKDLSGNNNHGTLYVVGGNTVTSTGRYGENSGAYSLDGNDYISVADSNFLDMGTGDYSIVLSLKTGNDVTSVFQAPLNKGSQGADFAWYNFRIMSNFIQCYVGDDVGPGYFVNGMSSAVSANSYYQVVLSINRNGSQKFYKNSSQVGSATTVNTLNINSGAALEIGRQDGGQYFTGTIYEVRLYNKALSQAEVTALYNATRP